MTKETTAGVLVLKGVDHTARPTWKLRETVHFYRDLLGLPLVHVISARGWGTDDHPDFLHFFFDSGKGSTIAFFYYLGSTPPASLEGRAGRRPVPEDHVFDATHTAWQVDTPEELQAWKERLQSRGIEVSAETAHEVLSSIYFRDPNGYFIEITRKLRALQPLDARDAAATLEAAMAWEEDAQAGRAAPAIDGIWARKAALLGGPPATAAPGLIRLFVLKVPEFAPVLAAARAAGARVADADGGDYAIIESSQPLELGRQAMGLKPAVWWGLFTGGLQGRIERFGRDLVRIVAAEPPRS